MNVGASRGVKKGFSGPDEIWFRNKNKVLDTIGKDAYIWNFLHREKTYNLLEHHFRGKRNLRLFVWSLLQLELTLRKVCQ
jgi:hypothetical protein